MQNLVERLRQLLPAADRSRRMDGITTTTEAVTARGLTRGQMVKALRMGEVGFDGAADDADQAGAPSSPAPMARATAPPLLPTRGGSTITLAMVVAGTLVAARLSVPGGDLADRDDSAAGGPSARAGMGLIPRNAASPRGAGGVAGSSQEQREMMLKKLTGVVGVIVLGTAIPNVAAMGTAGIVRCWGWNNQGQCDVPQNLGRVLQVAACDYQTIVVRTDGTVVAWGWNDFGQGNVPPGLSDVTHVAAGIRHNMALRSNGQVICWGRNLEGQCAVPSNMLPVTTIASGGYQSIAVQTNGSVRVWGWNAWGVCNVPPAAQSVIQIAGGYAFATALRADGTVICWGNNDQGQCNVPPGLSGVVKIASGDTHTLALKADGTIITWGSNLYGQRSVPSILPAVAEIACGANHTMVQTLTGELVAWGWNDHGQSDVPTNIGDVLQIAPGLRHNAVLVADPCAGDILVDSLINGADLGALLSYWGPVTSSPISRDCDINGDEIVDGFDLGMLLANWGPCGP